MKFFCTKPDWDAILAGAFPFCHFRLATTNLRGPFATHSLPSQPHTGSGPGKYERDDTHETDGDFARGAERGSVVDARKPHFHGIAQ